MKVAHIYARYSLKIQGSGDSLRRQIGRAEQYAAEQGWTVAEPLIDDGVPAFRGANLERGVLREFMDALAKGRITPGSILIIESLDRLSRNTITEQFGLLLTIVRSGIELVTLIDRKHFTNQMINANPLELIVSMAVMIRAHEESLLKSRRVSSAWLRKRRTAGRQKLTRRCPPWLRANDDRTDFVPIPSRVGIVKDIFRWAAAGWGPQMIVNRLTSDNCEAWGKDAAWTLTKVLDVLQSRTVLGEFQPHMLVDRKSVPVGDVVRGYYPAVVSSEIFSKANRGFKFGDGTQQGDANLFIGLAWDGETGERMVKRNAYLTNQSSNRGGVRHRWAYRAFEQNVLGQLEQLDWEALLTEPREEDQVNERDRLQSEIEEVELKLERAVDRVTLNDSCSDSLADEIERMEQRLINLREQLKFATADGTQAIEATKEMRQARVAFLEAIAAGNTESRLRLRQELRSLIRRIDLWPRPQAANELAAYYPLLESAVSAAGLTWNENPRLWAYYKITFSNGQQRWVLCQRAKLSSDDLRSPRCANNAGVVVYPVSCAPSKTPGCDSP